MPFKNYPDEITHRKRRMHVWSPIWQIFPTTLAFYRCANKLREEGLPTQGHTANLVVQFENSGLSLCWALSPVNSLRQPWGLAQGKASWVLLGMSHCHLSRASYRFQVASQPGPGERLDVHSHCHWWGELVWSPARLCVLKRRSSLHLSECVHGFQYVSGNENTNSLLRSFRHGDLIGCSF